MSSPVKNHLESSIPDTAMSGTRNCTTTTLLAGLLSCRILLASLADNLDI